MKVWTREELEELGFDNEKIEAIVKQQENLNVTPSTENNVTQFKKSFSESDITTVSDIQKYSQGTIVELPSFDGENPFVAKLRRPSLLCMVKSGKIPNSLINQATQLFQKGAGSLGKDNTVSDMYDIMESICDAALVNPTYSEIKNAGLSLTDEQMMAIFSYTQQGVKALEQFR